jgi:hypothetical protein
MFPVYCGKCLSRKTVHIWVDTFSQGRSKVADDVRPGRPVQIAADATVQRVEEFFRADRRIALDSVTTVLGYAHSFAYSTMHDGLKLRKVRSLQHPLRSADEAEDMLSRIVSGVESSVHHYQPESKRVSVQWKHPSSHSIKKFKVKPSAGKVMLTTF